MSKPGNPIELIDRYLQAVRFWMPKTQRQEDLLAELGDDLRSQMEDKEATLGRPLEAEEVSDILKRCGAPMVVAARLGPSKSLIGPALYPIYIFVLKMVLFWILVPVFIFILGPFNVAYSGGDWTGALVATIANLWSGLFIAAGIVTLVFAIIERTSAAHAAVAVKFDPMSLPPVQKTERKPTTLKTLCQLIFAVFGMVWLLLIPRYPELILGPAAAFLKAGPVGHSFYIPILLFAIVTIVRPIAVLARPQSTWLPPVAELVQAILTLILLNFMLAAAGQMTHGEWYPFVVLSDAVRNSTQYIRVAAIVNVSILVSLVCAWFGLAIAVIVQLWLLLRHFRKSRTGAGQAAPLQAQ
jgi:hypothetical protein